MEYTAGLSSNCVHTSLNSATNEGWTKHSSINVRLFFFFLELCTDLAELRMKTLHLFVKLVGWPRKLEVDFSQFLMLN